MRASAVAPGMDGGQPEAGGSHQGIDPAAGRRAGVALTDDQVLRWVTANPAWVLGIERVTGTLEVGKRADVVVWTGSPFSVYSQAALVLIAGDVAYDRAVGLRPSDLELGVGAATRINWGSHFWGGTWPLEMWVDYRYRRGVGGDDAREHEVRGGLDYTPTRWLDRVGVQVAGTGDHLDDGRAVRGLAMLVTLQYGRGL